jgi:hypothetical protein
MILGIRKAVEEFNLESAKGCQGHMCVSLCFEDMNAYEVLEVGTLTLLTGE